MADPYYRIPNDQLRALVVEGVEAGRFTWKDLGRTVFGERQGWQAVRLRRALGVNATTYTKNGRRYEGHRQRHTEAVAYRIMCAIGADPFEVGL